MLEAFGLIYETARYATFYEITAIVIAVGATVLAFRAIWKYFIKPLHKFMTVLMEFIEAQPTLVEIASEFKKNDGHSLRDQVDYANIRLSNLEGQVEVVISHFINWDGTERRQEGIE